MTGWDSPTTRLYQRDLAKMSAAPVNGTTIWVEARYPKGHPKAGERVAEVKNGTPFRTTFSRETMIFQLGVSGQPADSAIVWFDDARVVEVIKQGESVNPEAHKATGKGKGAAP